MHLGPCMLGLNSLSGSLAPVSGLLSLRSLSVPANALSGSVAHLAPLRALQIVDVGANRLREGLRSAHACTRIHAVHMCDNSS